MAGRLDLPRARVQRDLRDHAASGQRWAVTDGFVVAGCRFGALIPYVQLEARAGDGAADPYYNPNPAMPPASFVEGIAGLHYDLNAWSALKLELAYGQFPNPNATVENDYRVELNWSFGRRAAR